MKMVVENDGSIRCVYGEELDLQCLGKLTIARGSHVEPTTGGQRSADLSAVSGPVLGAFSNRSDALAADRQWIEVHWLIRAR
jgi:hypothetical protein